MKKITLLAISIMISVMGYSYIRIAPFIPLFMPRHYSSSHGGDISKVQGLLMIFCFTVPSILFYVYRSIKWSRIKESKPTFIKYVIWTGNLMLDDFLVDLNTIWVFLMLFISLPLALFFGLSYLLHLS